MDLSAAAAETEIKEAIPAQIFKVKVAAVRTGQISWQDAPARPNEGYRRDWKKAYVELAEGEKMIEYAENL